MDTNEGCENSLTDTTGGGVRRLHAKGAVSTPRWWHLPPVSAQMGNPDSPPPPPPPARPPFSSTPAPLSLSPSPALASLRDAAGQGLMASGTGTPFGALPCPLPTLCPVSEGSVEARWVQWRKGWVGMGSMWGCPAAVAGTVFVRGRTVRCARAVRALCEKLAVLHHREFGKFRRLKGCQ